MRLAATGEGTGETLVYVHGEEEMEETARLLSGSGVTLVSIQDFDWNRDLSPWPAPAAFRGGGDFAGEGPSHLTRLLSAIDEFEKGRAWQVKRRGIGGYSLAGLFALYAACACDRFDFAVSASGSLWYDGFLEYMRSHPARVRAAYLSLGDKEPRAKNPRLAKVGEATEEAARILAAQGVNTRFEWNPGNHFVDAPARLSRGILDAARRGF